MLFYENLEDIVFHRNEIVPCDEFVVLSGYVGPHPVHRLKDLPIKTTVIYGMYGSDGIRQGLHSALIEEKNRLDHVDILYSTMPVHAKCYIWKDHGRVVHALVGSANFSTSGLATPFKEVLAETTRDTFDPLNRYLNLVISTSIPCENAVVKNNPRRPRVSPLTGGAYDPDICSMPLYIIKRGRKTTHAAAGVNWCMSERGHVSPNDAYIPIRADMLRHYPLLFPAKSTHPLNLDDVQRTDHRHNDSIEIIWDDGTRMTGLLEGDYPMTVNDQQVVFPKNFTTTPRKSTLGKYLRDRLGVGDNERITIEDLQRYGRDTIDVSLQGEGIYYFDFSV